MKAELNVPPWETCFVELDQRWTLARHMGDGRYTRLVTTWGYESTAKIMAAILNAELQKTIEAAVAGKAVDQTKP